MNKGTKIQIRRKDKSLVHKNYKSFGRCLFSRMTLHSNCGMHLATSFQRTEYGKWGEGKLESGHCLSLAIRSAAAVMSCGDGMYFSYDVYHVGFTHRTHNPSLSIKTSIRQTPIGSYSIKYLIITSQNFKVTENN